MSKLCKNKGTNVSLDGGLVCYECLSLHEERGNSNLNQFPERSNRQLGRAVACRTREESTPSDFSDANEFKHPTASSLKGQGVDLVKEALAQVKYANQLANLAEHLPQGSLKLAVKESVPSSLGFLLTAHKIYLPNPTFCNSIVTTIFEGLVLQLTTGAANAKTDPRLMNLYHHFNTIIHNVAEAVSTNLGHTPPKRWMRTLNYGERTLCVFDCELKDSRERMMSATNKRKVDGKPLSFSFAIDATKTPKVLEISTSHQVIMGACYPIHKISTVDMTAIYIKPVPDQKTGCKIQLEKALEIKVAFMVFQQVPKGVSPVEIITACPQSVKQRVLFVYR